MQLSDETLTILKSFAGINPSIMFKPGNVVRTISPQKTVMAAANVSESFEKSAGIYDLNRFHAVINLFENPDLSFLDDKFEIKDQKSNMYYTYAAENLIVTPPERDITVPDPEVVFDLKWETLDRVLRAANVMQLPEVGFLVQNDTISLAALDTSNPTADKYSVDVADSSNATVPDTDLQMIIKAENLRIMSGDYNVSLSSKGMAHFKSDKVQYWIAIESK